MIPLRISCLVGFKGSWLHWVMLEMQYVRKQNRTDGVDDGKNGLELGKVMDED